MRTRFRLSETLRTVWNTEKPVKTTSIDPNVTSIRATMNDGSVVEYRRAGPVPDVFVSEKGSVLRLQKATTFSVSGNSVLKYRDTSLSLRNLVADAWHPGWRQEFDSIQHVNGDRDDCSAWNLRPVVGHKGRPSSSALVDQAMIYQLFKVHPNLEDVASELGIKPKEVRAAVAAFDPALLQESPPNG